MPCSQFDLVNQHKFTGDYCISVDSDPVICYYNIVDLPFTMHLGERKYCISVDSDPVICCYNIVDPPFTMHLGEMKYARYIKLHGKSNLGKLL